MRSVGLPAAPRETRGPARLVGPYAYRHVARLYPAAEHDRVVLIIDNAPWHHGGPIYVALAVCPHVEFYRLPSYSLQFNVLEQIWKILRRHPTQSRDFDVWGT